MHHENLWSNHNEGQSVTCLFSTMFHSCHYYTGCSKSHETHGEMQYKFYFLLLCHFLIISAENVHHYALHRDAHDESC
jgi:hypothetical protein